MHSGTMYTTLEDLENRLDAAIERGEIDEAEARREMEEAIREELRAVNERNR